MSRGFVKEGDQEETPIVPPRVHLPAGVTNYVTHHGYDALKQEQTELVEERRILKEQSTDLNRVQINYLSAKLLLLEERIHSAKVIDLTLQPTHEIHFGARVTLYKEEEKCNCQYQIVGVDEANISKNKISFLSPMARVLLNKKIGEKVTLQTPKGNRIMQVEKIEYLQ